MRRLGYDPRRTLVIPNGFDCSAFRPDAEARASIRNELGLSDGVPLIGLVARVHPDKDHGNFLRAAEQLVSPGEPAHFLMVGRGTKAYLAAQSAALKLTGRYHALDEGRDMPAIMNALDIATCSSQTEAFPNVIGEAMACGGAGRGHGCGRFGQVGWRHWARCSRSKFSGAGRSVAGVT